MFLGEYNSLSSKYDFIDSLGNPTNTSLKPTTKLTLNDGYNRKALCNQCKAAQIDFYQACNERIFVSKENEFRIFVRDKLKSDAVRCKKCYNWLTSDKSLITTSVARLQDVRFCSRPTCLIVQRERYKCPRCGILEGDDLIIGFQAYCDGNLSIRLAEKIIYAQLSSVKRALIAEAYGITRKQVDRIKDRIIHQSREARSFHLQYCDPENTSSPVICKELKDNSTGHVYLLYFLMHPTEGIVLIDVLSQAERAALSAFNRDEKSIRDHFPDVHSFHLACFACISAEQKLTGKALAEAVQKLTEWYNSRFSSQDEAKDFSIDYTVQLSKVEFDPKNLQSLRRLLRRKRVKSKMSLSSSIKAASK